MKLDYIKLVVTDMKSRKFSTFLTFFAISLGILTIFVIFLLSQGFENSIAKQFEQMGTNRLYVASNGQSITSSQFTKGLSDNEVNLIENKPYVEKVYPYYMKSSSIKYGNEYKRTQLMGTKLSEDFFNENNLKLNLGRFPDESESYSIVLGAKASEELFSKKVPLGSNIYIKDTKFKVVGILESIGNPQDDSNIFVNYKTLRDTFEPGTKNIGVMDVVIVEGYDLEIAKANLKTILENKLGKDSIEIIAPTQLLEQFSSILNIVKYTLGGIAFVALIVGAVGIINTMYVIITEKTHDIGVMKSIGARNGDILFMYIFMAGLFGFLGAVLGVILGSFAALGFEAFAKSAGYDFLEITIQYTDVIILLIFGFIIGIISGYLPAKKASKINILEAIRKWVSYRVAELQGCRVTGLQSFRVAGLQGCRV